MSKNKIYKSILIGIIFPILLYIAYRTPIKHWLNVSYVEKLREIYGTGVIIIPFLLITGVSIGLGMPRSVVSFLSGSIFGLWFGIIIAEISSLLGASITFFYGRWSRKKLFSDSISIIDKYASQYPFFTVLIIRQLPVPGFLANIFIGLSCIDIRTFILASSIGFLPQNVIFTLYGCGFQKNILYGIIGSFLLIILSILMYYLYQKSAMFRNLMKISSSNK